MGQLGTGRKLLAGEFHLAGRLVEAEEPVAWALPVPDPAFGAELHGFTWLDDLVAVGDAEARAMAQTWVRAWIGLYGRRGKEWPDVTGRRLLRWIGHAGFLERGWSQAEIAAFRQSLQSQARRLGRRWRLAPAGLPRFEALTGLIHAATMLEGLDPMAGPAAQALARECQRQVDPGGGIASRNPEELLDVLTLLTWAVHSLSAAEREVPEEIAAAVVRIAPTLRLLRHSDGTLARFHGGGRGQEGKLDRALATSGVRPRLATGELRMGYARLAAGRTSLIADAAAPPTGADGAEAHASTLAFELTSGRRPLIVSCGAGRSFGPEWRRAARATASHSTLELDGYSSARLGPRRRGRERLTEGPVQVLVERARLDTATRLELAHSGYRGTYGLTHARTIDLSTDGRSLSGEDLLTTLDETDEARFDRLLDSLGHGPDFALRFHLHPEVEAALEEDGDTVRLTLRSGEVWRLEHGGGARLTVEPSVHLEKNRPHPRPSRQVVFTGRAMAYATRIRWSLAKTEQTPDAIRDLATDDPLADADEQES